MEMKHLPSFALLIIIGSFSAQELRAQANIAIIARGHITLVQPNNGGVDLPGVGLGTRFIAFAQYIQGTNPSSISSTSATYNLDTGMGVSAVGFSLGYLQQTFVATVFRTPGLDGLTLAQNVPGGPITSLSIILTGPTDFLRDLSLPVSLPPLFAFSTAEFILTAGDPAGANTVYLANVDSLTVLGGPACQANVPPPPVGSRWYQLDPTWAGEHYDNANPPKNTIGDQGCALTALAAVLGTVGVSIDPGSLNTLLVGYPGVYSQPSLNVPNSGGRIDFPSAVTNVGGGALWFDLSQSGQTSTQALDLYVCAQSPKPVIVQVTNSKTGHQHYVAVTGRDSTGYSIIDPGYQSVSSLSTYMNQFTVAGVVKKASGDPSALALAVVDTATLLVTAPDGSQTGVDPVSGQVLKGTAQSAYFEQNNSIDTDAESVDATSVTYSVDYSFPEDGTYSVQLIGLKSGTYQLSMNSFDANGVHQGYIVKSGVTSTGSISAFQLQYSSATGGGSSVTRLATFASTLADIGNSLQLSFIDNAGIAMALSAKIDAAADAVGRGDKAAALNVLNSFKNQVSAQSGKHITGIAPQVLQEDADSLIGQNTR